MRERAREHHALALAARELAAALADDRVRALRQAPQRRPRGPPRAARLRHRPRSAPDRRASRCCGPCRAAGSSPAARSRSCGATARQSTRCSGSSSIQTSPSCGRSSAVTRSITVVLPAPDAPTIAVMPPAGIVSAALRRIQASRYRKPTFSKRIACRSTGVDAFRRILAFAVGALDRRLHRPVGALARDHPLIFALHAAHVEEDAHEQEREQHHRRERHAELAPAPRRGPPRSGWRASAPAARAAPPC